MKELLEQKQVEEDDKESEIWEGEKQEAEDEDETLDWEDEKEKR